MDGTTITTGSQGVPRHGIAPYELDPSWKTIRGMTAVGLATRLRPVPYTSSPTRGSGRTVRKMP
jgi:hypothetical protein